MYFSKPKRPRAHNTKVLLENKYDMPPSKSPQYVNQTLSSITRYGKALSTLWYVPRIQRFQKSPQQYYTPSHRSYHIPLKGSYSLDVPRSQHRQMPTLPHEVHTTCMPPKTATLQYPNCTPVTFRRRIDSYIVWDE